MITERILREIMAELERGRALHPGTDDLPDGTGGGGRRTFERIAKNSYERAARDGTLTMAHGFEEETAEALAADRPIDIRRELIQVAAYAVKWVAAIDTRLEAEIQRWHQDEDARPLHDALGMTWDEYREYVSGRAAAKNAGGEPP